MGIVSLKYDVSFKYLMLNETVRRYFISDVLGLPSGEIRCVRLGHTFLWRRLRRHKAGILDILVELNDDSKINIELQIRKFSHWDKRSLFYLSKMFTEDLLAGEKYQKLKRCICINILDFNLDDLPEYHKIYRLRDKAGNEFSDLFEIHILELRKPLGRSGDIDNWIKLINAQREEELDMIRTKNPGIQEAILELRHMNLRRELRALYEAHQKEVRDQYAREDYVREEGISQGKAEGIAQGKAEGILAILGTKGLVPDQVRQVIQEQGNVAVLDQWLLLAAGARNVEMFREQAGI